MNRLMSFGSRLRWARERLKLGQGEVATACGWRSQSRVSNYERDVREPTFADVRRLAQAVQVNPEWLINGTGLAVELELPSDHALELTAAITTPSRKAPVEGTAQGDEGGTWVTLERSAGQNDGWIDVPSSDPNAYALRIRGDAMSPTIRDGWFIVLEPGHSAMPGEFVLVTTQDGHSMVRELLFERANTIALASINETQPRITLPQQEIHTMHYVGFIVPPSKHRR